MPVPILIEVVAIPAAILDTIIKLNITTLKLTIETWDGLAMQKDFIVAL